MFSLRTMFLVLAMVSIVLASFAMIPRQPAAPFVAAFVLIVLIATALGRRRGRGVRGFFAGLAIVGAITLLLGLTGTRGGLAHFSAHTLEFQSQSQFTVLGGMYPVYRSPLVTSNHELLDFIKQEGFVTPERPQGQHWESLWHWNEAWHDGYSDFYRLLFRDRHPIIEWSKEDRQRAEIYWSEGFAYLRTGRQIDKYVGLEILRTGYRCQSIPALEANIAAIKKELAQLFNQQPYQLTPAIVASTKQSP